MNENRTQGGIEVTLEAELEQVKHQAALAAQKRRDEMLVFLNGQLDPTQDNNSSSKAKLKVNAVFMISSKPDERGLTEVSCNGPDGIFTAWLRGKTLAYVADGW